MKSPLRLLAIGAVTMIMLAGGLGSADGVPDAPQAPDRTAAPDPVWEAQAVFPEHRTEVSAATDGKRIFVVGGFGPPEGDERATAPRTLWAYTPGDDAWEALGEIPQGVHHTALVHHGGRLYILGGFRETSFDPVADVHIYDIASGTWGRGAPMPTPRGAAGFTVLDGRIHVIGGNVEDPEHVHDHTGERATEDRSVNTHEAYDPATDSWTQLAPMPTPRNHLGAAALGGRIHAVLGRADGNYTMTTHEVYDPTTDSWAAAADVPTGRSGVAVLALEGYVYTFGGETFDEAGGRTYRDAERYDPRTGRWEALAPMPTARHGLGAAAFGGDVYVISGGPGPGFTFGNANERLVLAP
jgi:N-acetylneuraminic acid mutarotase